MSIIKSIKQVLGLHPAAENHFWDGSVPNELSLKRGTPDAPGATVLEVVAGQLSPVQTGPAFRALLSANQGVVQNSIVKANIDQVIFDTAGCFANGRFTPNVPGYYQINVSIHHNSSLLTAASTLLYFNGVNVLSNGPAGGFADAVQPVSTTLYFNGTTDYVEVWGFQQGGTNNLFSQGSTQMSGFLARKN